MAQRNAMRLLGTGLALAVIAAGVAGCGPLIDRMRLARQMAPEGPYGTGLTRSAAILPIQNRTRVAEPTVAALFRQPAAERLRNRCPQFRFSGPLPETLPPALAAMGSETATSVLTNQTLLQTARDHGYVALVGIALSDVQVFSKPKGIWIFTYDDFTMDITAEVVVFSAETGAKQFDAHLSVSQDISDLDYQAFRENPAHPVGAIDEALDDLVDDLVDAACDAMGSISWFAQVESVTDGSVILSAGAASGLTAGMRLQVYSGNDRITGNSATEYHIPGRLHGMVTIDRVDARTATATIIDGAGAIAVGDLVIPVK